MHYYAYEMAHAVVSPLRFGMQALRHTLDWPLNPMAHTMLGKNIRAACEVFEKSRVPQPAVEADVRLSCGCDGFYQVFDVHRPGCVMEEKPPEKGGKPGACPARGRGTPGEVI